MTRVRTAPDGSRYVEGVDGGYVISPDPRATTATKTPSEATTKTASAAVTQHRDLPRLARMVHAALSHPHAGTTPKARVATVIERHPVALTTFGIDALEAAARHGTGCRWCASTATAKLAGRQTPALATFTAPATAQALRDLLGEPCRSCLLHTRWWKDAA